MTWQNAKSRAAALVAALLPQIAAARAAGQRVEVIPLSEYPTFEDYHDLQGGTPADWRLATDTTRAMKRELSRHGLRAAVVPMHAAEVRLWLKTTGRENTPENRALYVSGHTPSN